MSLEKKEFSRYIKEFNFRELFNGTMIRQPSPLQ